MCGWTDFMLMSVYMYGLYAVLFTGYRTARRLFPPFRAYLPAMQTRAILRPAPHAEEPR